MSSNKKQWNLVVAVGCALAISMIADKAQAQCCTGTCDHSIGLTKAAQSPLVIGENYEVRVTLFNNQLVDSACDTLRVFSVVDTIDTSPTEQSTGNLLTLLNWSFTGGAFCDFAAPTPFCELPTDSTMQSTFYDTGIASDADDFANQPVTDFITIQYMDVCDGNSTNCNDQDLLEQQAGSSTTVIGCGDGEVNAPGETCDDGNDINNDGCRNDCTFCGDNILDAGELCDDGNNTDGDGCEADCTPTPVCGDNVINVAGETCDGTDASGCNEACRAPGTADPCTCCGDGMLQTGEECDDGNSVAGDGCDPDCTIPAVCGDNMINAPGETCDGTDAATCNEPCRASCTCCGDGLLQGGESCDDGNSIDDDDCRNDCTRCGDGILDAGEQCDDGNNTAGDGCDPNCVVEGGGDGCTPGYWKLLERGRSNAHHECNWTAPYDPDDMFSDHFENAFPGMTLHDVLSQGGGGLKALGRHTVAALLNAASPDVSYDIGSPQDVIDDFNAAYPGGDYNGLKSIFAGFNEQGCPLGNCNGRDADVSESERPGLRRGQRNRNN